MKVIHVLVVLAALAQPQVAYSHDYDDDDDTSVSDGCSWYGERCKNETLGDYYRRSYDNDMHDLRRLEIPHEHERKRR